MYTKKKLIIYTKNCTPRNPPKFVISSNHSFNFPLNTTEQLNIFRVEAHICPAVHRERAA